MYSTMRLQTIVGKLGMPWTLGPISDGRTKHRPFVTDKKTKIQYIVDTGAEVSLIPKKFLGQSFVQ